MKKHKFKGNMDDDCKICGFSIYHPVHVDDVAEGLRIARKQLGLPELIKETKE